MPATLPLLWKTRQRLMATVLVLLMFFISLAGALGEFMPARASSPLWHNLQASLVRTSNGPLSPFVPPATSTQTNTDVPTIMPTDDPSTNQPGEDTPTPGDNYPTSTDYPPANPTNPVADQPDSGYDNGVTTQPTDPSSPTRTPTPSPTRTSSPTPTPTNTPTKTPSPTDTPTPTNTPVPTGSCTASSPTPTSTITATSTVTATPTATPPTTAGTPTLTSLEPVTSDAFGQDGVYVPNSWGVQKSRIVSTSTGDLFAVYISVGTGTQDRTWHLMHRTPGATGKWEEVKINNTAISNDAGTEPINILVSPDNAIHLFIWPGTQGKLEHVYSNDLGATFEQEDVAGSWSKDQGYSGATINSKGDMVVYQTGSDIPGEFLWSYYSASNKNWTFHTNTLDCRYTYAFFFLGDNNDLTITAMRDVKREELGLTAATSGFDYIFNKIGYFYSNDVTAATPQMTFVPVTEVAPKSNTDYDITYLTDSYVDTSGRVHLLYNDMYDGNSNDQYSQQDGLHHVIIENGKVVYDELQKDGNQQPIKLGMKTRITQDKEGHFYLITMDPSGKYLNVYPGTNSDTDGTQLEKATQLDISSMPGCTDDDFCHSPTFTVPRSGNARSDVIDGLYGNYTNEIYFQINLRGTARS